MLTRKVHHHSLLAFHGGATRVKHILGMELAKSGWEVTNSCELYDLSGDTPEDKSDLAEAEIFAVELSSHLKAETVCHLHTTADWALLCSSMAQQESALKPPVVITLHDTSLLTGGCVNPLGCPGINQGCISPCPQGYKNVAELQLQRRKALLSLAPYLVSPSQWVAKSIKKNVPELLCRLIPNGVEENFLPASKARETLGLAPGAVMALFVAHGGVMSSLKGAGQWLDIWKGIKAKVPNLVGFMVGGNSASRQGDLIEWPYVDREKLQLLMAAADIMIYPSLADNHPLVVLEAMSASTAVCAYNVGGIPEQVRHGETGFLVPLEDKSALVDACAEVLLTPGLARKLGRAGKEVYVRHFKAEGMAAKYQSLYSELL